MSDLILTVYFSTLEAAWEGSTDENLGELVTLDSQKKSVNYVVSEENVCHAIAYLRDNRGDLQIDDWETFDHWEQKTIEA